MLRRRPTPRPPGPWGRAALGAVIGLITAAVLVGGLGLLGPAPTGAGDNADGFRLFCSARLAPATPERLADWRGVVVTDFTTDGIDCPRPSASSAATVLRATVAVTATPDGRWSLGWLGLVWAALLGVGAGLAGAAATAVSYRRAAVLAAPLLPLLAVPWWSRFLVSTYFEPAGLVGTAWVLLAALALAVTRPEHRGSRLLALGLLVAGGLLAATAKPGYVPVAAGAALLAAATVLRAPSRPTAPSVGDRSGPSGPSGPSGRGWRSVAWRAAGPVAAVALAAGLATPVAAAVRWQDESYAGVNTHNLVFTTVLPEVGPAAMTALGLPPAAAGHSGQGFYWPGAAGWPGWEAIGDRPEEARSTAYGLLARHPDVAARVLGHGMTATLRPQLAYLPSAARGTAPEINHVRTVYPEAGPLTPLLLAWLDGIALPALPVVLALLAALAAAATLVPWARRRAGPRAVGLARTAGLAAATGVALVALAVAGDGYYELTKHVWLASYVLAVTALILPAALAFPAPAGWHAFRDAARARTSRRSVPRPRRGPTAAAPAAPSTPSRRQGAAAPPHRERVS